MTDNTVNSLVKSIDQHAPPVRKGQRESHEIGSASLAQRILVSPEQHGQIVAEGLLKPLPLTRGGVGGHLAFDSDELNGLRHAVLSHVAAGVLEQSSGDETDNSNDGSDEGLRAAVAAALKAHVESFTEPDATPNEFCRRSSGNGAILMLSRQDPNEDQKPAGNGLLKTVGKTAAVVGAGAGALYGIGHLASKYNAAQIASKFGEPVAAAYLKNIGIGQKLKSGWNIVKGGAKGSVAGAVVGGAAGAGWNAGTQASDAMEKLRKLAGSGA